MERKSEFKGQLVLLHDFLFLRFFHFLLPPQMLNCWHHRCFIAQLDTWTNRQPQVAIYPRKNLMKIQLAFPFHYLYKTESLSIFVCNQAKNTSEWLNEFLGLRYKITVSKIKRIISAKQEGLYFSHLLLIFWIRFIEKG